MTTLTWLHLSDLHLRDPETSVDSVHLGSMLEDIRILAQKENLVLDGVFFTGDVAFSAQDPQYKLATGWFDKVLDACALSGQRDRLFIVPGNHDVDRDVVNRTKLTSKQHESFAEDLLGLEDSRGVDDFLRCEPDRKWAFEKFQSYARFIDEFYHKKECEFDHNRYYFVRHIEKEGHTVVIMGLNSAWLSFRDDEQGRLLVGEVQVCDALRESENKYPEARWHIALVHHPLYWLAEKDIHWMQQHLPGKCHLLLHGHLHHSSFSIQSTPDSYLHVFAAGASLKARYHAYNIVRLDLDTGDGIAYVRLQHNDIGKTWGPDSLTYRNAVNGKIAFSLTSGKEPWPDGEAAKES